MRNRKSKIRVGILFGGRSAEHEVSLVSAASIINALDKKKYEVIPIGITPDGRWVSSDDILAQLRIDKKIKKNTPEMILVPDPTKRKLVCISKGVIKVDNKPLDIIFPVLHGTFGEDGTIQGLLELASIPYVGAGVLGSSIGMDKVITKQLCEHAEIPIVPYVSLLVKYYRRDKRKYLNKIENETGYPCFIKPVNLGSSVGISKAHNRKELQAAIKLAAMYDRKILVEKSIENAHEIEISVLGNDEPIASVPGEIISSNEFYDYDAKYVDGKSKSIIPARLPKSVSRDLKTYATRGFLAIECAGMARIDFLVERKSNNIFLNEINTIPGFTSISMYPKLWEASGISYRELLDRLIGLAFERYVEKRNIKTAFRPKMVWYR